MADAAASASPGATNPVKLWRVEKTGAHRDDGDADAFEILALECAIGLDVSDAGEASEDGLHLAAQRPAPFCPDRRDH
jgi:hypothetical protein